MTARLSTTNANTTKPRVSVRTLCEFAAKRGDLDTRFTPTPNAREGIIAHQWVQQKRLNESVDQGYEAEVPLELEIGGLILVGRADGFDSKKKRVEEIKTRLGKTDTIPQAHQSLHWAQVSIYGAMLCTSRGLRKIELALVYLDYLTFKETVVRRKVAAAELVAMTESLCAAYVEWAHQEQAHRALRDSSLAELNFAFPDFRAGQRELARAVFAAGRDAKPLMVNAPTGIGKTIATLYGALRAVPRAGVDRVYYLTPRSTGKELAWQGIGLLRTANHSNIRALELTAKEKACVRPERACHPLSCDLTVGFYDRLPQARQALVDEVDWSLESLQRTAEQHQICPYFLQQEMARWADVLIGDYNYYYSPNPALYALAKSLEWKVTVLVDEAHNLTERARGMYSCVLSLSKAKALRVQAPRKLRNQFKTLVKRWTELSDTHAPFNPIRSLPEPLSEALQEIARTTLNYFVDNPAHYQPLLQDFMFSVMQLQNFMGSEASAQTAYCDLSEQGDLHWRCVVPAEPLALRHEFANNTVCFTATLPPPQSFLELNGLPDKTELLELPSPFSADQLKVRLASNLDTRFAQREETIAPIAGLIAKTFNETPGNYLAFFSSYQYLAQIREALVELAPELPLRVQESKMSEPDQQSYLSSFQAGGKQVGLAVLGGSFSEGIDLPGRRLEGVFVVTLGLPQVNPVNEQFAQVLHARFGQGFEYQYLYPGLQKVVQAAGRLLRTETDTGFLWLLDQRFAQPRVRALLPSWWEIESVRL